MRVLIAAAAIAAMVQSGPALASAYAESAARLAEAIRAGDTATQRAMLPPLTAVEYEELARLAGCKAFMNPAGGENYLLLDWVCDAPGAAQSSARSTVMMFDDHGEIFGFSLNSRLSDLAPTEVALQKAQLPEPRALLRRFGEAVVAGADPSLGGLLPLGDFERARLARYEGGHFRPGTQRFDGQLHLFLSEGSGRSSPRQEVILRLDEQGRPSGLVFTPTYKPDGRSRYHDDGTLDQTVGL